jgi:starch phosphorylase
VFTVKVYLGDLPPEDVRVELYADPVNGSDVICQAMERTDQIPGATNAYTYRARVPASRPLWHFTPRAIPSRPDARVPTETHCILWER